MIIPPRFLLPSMMFTGLLVVGFRVGDLWDAVASGKLFEPVQQVQAAEEKPAAPAQTAETKAEPQTKEKQEAKAASAAPAPKTSGSPESDLYKQLMGRRDQLDKREQEIGEREALVVIAEKRVEKKIQEMEVMKKQLETLIGQASAAQQAQIENLVKIYEIMKPKEAAKIFETLDMPILLGVVQKMKPARTAPVLAEMNPEKAKEITTALTRQDQLPQVK
jgi:flagellar motility protein MotE (MotC chaperone)